MAYVSGKLAVEAEILGYRVYTTDCLMTMANNLAHSFGGKEVKARYIDIIRGNTVIKEPESAEDVINSIISKSGLEVVE